MARICSKCGVEKSNDEFYMRSDKPHLMQSHCKACIVERRKAFRLENIERFKKRDIEYHARNRAKRLEYLKSYQKENLPARRVYNTMKMKNDVHFAIRHRIHSRIGLALRHASKKSTSSEYLGCTIQEFKKYFESKFTDGMTWDAFLRGEIHIDHIIPCAAFDLTKYEEQIKCFHFTNLQPLFAMDNILKRDKMEVCHR